MHPVNRILDLFGLRLSRVPRPAPQGNGVPVINLGQFQVKAPIEGPLYQCYIDNPQYNAEIGRIAALTYSRYPDMIAIDVGANIGDTAAILRGACPSPIICVEGDPAIGDILAENVAPLGEVRIVRAFLGERREERPMIVAKEGWNSTLMPARDGAPGTIVPFLTLDEVIPDEERGRVKVLKIDTEGHEGHVLRGARRTLCEARPVVLFEHNRDALSTIGADGTDVFAGLRDLGYRTLLFWDSGGRFLLRTSLESMDVVEDLHEYVAFEGRCLGGIYYLDACAFHADDDDLAERCLAIERAVVRDRSHAGSR